MRNQIISLALIAGLAACSGGNPFDDTAETDGGGTAEETGGIPAVLAQNLQSFSYNPAAGTLTVTGVPTDDGVLDGVYRRRPALDRAGYEAYTAQDGSLDRHITAYVRDIRGTRAITIVSGSQFEEVVAGNAYSNTTYSAPAATQDGGLVTYAGTYVGLLNGGGSNEDLLDVTPGTSPSVLSAQAAEVRGRALINGDFADSTVTGAIFERVIVDVDSNSNQDVNSADPFPLNDVALDLTDIAEDGTFQGVATFNDSAIGAYGGIFGGTGATEVAGVVVLNNHITGLQGVIENGAFVLSQCGQADQDPICTQPFE
ncbi:hypothetical protein [Sulfitobacter guttiformis]|uniref:Thymidylate synthase n=1 Tax=Sulfitobacter guttiformis TaxID=74349 RepID=A0A420DJX4_9RHOB|nr:hypothetical protein [Sulfitobacter guttiformis]RKE94501.1 hypothetical protein C8N30_3629 [Sulfitobacter guttiformis]